MKIEDLKPNTIIRGALFPEPIQISTTIPIRSAVTEGEWGEKSILKLGYTALDRVHQSMILFAAGCSEALKRFLVEEGAGQDVRFWRLIQALSALYPAQSHENRWVDGVLARKKRLGF